MMKSQNCSLLPLSNFNMLNEQQSWLKFASTLQDSDLVIWNTVNMELDNIVPFDERVQIIVCGGILWPQWPTMIERSSDASQKAHNDHESPQFL